MADQQQIESALHLSNRDLAYVVMDRLNVVDPTDMVTLKIETAKDFLDELCVQLEETKTLYEDQLTEIQDQKDDLEHIYMAQRINGESNTDAMRTSNAISDLVVLRRTIKDASTATRIMFENFSRTRGFIRNMGSRAYTPKSGAFKNIARVKADVSAPKVTEEYRSSLNCLYSHVAEMVERKTAVAKTEGQTTISGSTYTKESSVIPENPLNAPIG